MHKLKSAHMLKFHDWYETRNNLWLILEYCTGGDLEALIKQDGHLPETSVRIFGLDIIAAMKVNHCLYSSETMITHPLTAFVLNSISTTKA